MFYFFYYFILLFPLFVLFVLFCFVLICFLILFCFYVLFWLAFTHFEFALSFVSSLQCNFFCGKNRKYMIDFPIGTVLRSMRAQKSCQNDSFTAFRDIFCEKPCLRLRFRLSWLRIALGYSTVSAYIHFLLFFSKLLKFSRARNSRRFLP